MKDNTSNIEGILCSILNYLEANRQVGHTTMMLEGATNHPNGIVLTHTNEMARELGKKYPDNVFVSMRSITSGGLCGRHSPLAVDNATLHLILGEALGEIQTQRGRVKELKRLVREAADAV